MASRQIKLWHTKHWLLRSWSLGITFSSYMKGYVTVTGPPELLALLVAANVIKLQHSPKLVAYFCRSRIQP